VARGLIVLLLALAACGKVPAAKAPCCPLPPDPPAVPEEGHEPLAAPKEGEWRSRFPEPAQGYERYRDASPNRRCAHRTTIYFRLLTAPIGRRSQMAGAEEREARAFEEMRLYAERYFAAPAKVLPAMPIFAETVDAGRGQADGSAVIDRLVASRPEDALIYVGIAEDDLYARGFNYVFGQGDLARRTGVYSLRRFQTKDERLFLKRALKLLAHEAGHILSIHHCVMWSCLMQGANSLPEHDAQPLLPCPEDQRKLFWAVGAERRAWLGSLREYFARTGLKEEEAWTAARLGR
jgi:archaemetzincin